MKKNTKYKIIITILLITIILILIVNKNNSIIALYRVSSDSSTYEVNDMIFYSSKKLKRTGFTGGNIKILDEELRANMIKISINICSDVECKFLFSSENWNEEKLFDKTFTISRTKLKTNLKCTTKKDGTKFTDLSNTYYLKIDVTLKDKTTQEEKIKLELKQKDITPKVDLCL